MRPTALYAIVIALAGCQATEPQDHNTVPPPQESATQPTKHDGLERTLESKGGEYIATLTLTRQPQTVLFGGPWGASGTDDELATDLAVYYMGKETPVWRSSFTDLANVREMTVTAKGDDATIELIGGDADSSFRCRIEFKKGQIKSRRVESAEFPENDYETTQYVEIPAGD